MNYFDRIQERIKLLQEKLVEAQSFKKVKYILKDGKFEQVFLEDPLLDSTISFLQGEIRNLKLEELRLIEFNRNFENGYISVQRS